MHVSSQQLSATSGAASPILTEPQANGEGEQCGSWHLGKLMVKPGRLVMAHSQPRACEGLKVLLSCASIVPHFLSAVRHHTPSPAICPVTKRL